VDELVLGYKNLRDFGLEGYTNLFWNAKNKKTALKQGSF
jgi:hypothetical protein